MWEFATQGHGIVILWELLMGYGIFRKYFSGNQVFEVEIYTETVTITPKMNGILDSQTSTPTCTPVHL